MIHFAIWRCGGGGDGTYSLWDNSHAGAFWWAIDPIPGIPINQVSGPLVVGDDINGDIFVLRMNKGA